MSNRVTAIRQFHETRSLGTPDSPRRQQERAAALSRALDPDQAHGLAQFALDAIQPGQEGDNKNGDVARYRPAAPHRPL